MVQCLRGILGETKPRGKLRIPKDDWPANLPNLNPVAREQLGYHYQDNLEGSNPNTLGELRRRLRLAWKNVL